MTQSESKRVPGSRWFRVAAWMFIVTSFGHVMGNHGPLKAAPNADQTRVVASMKELMMPVPGGAPRTLLDFFLGDSLTMGLLLLGFGAVNLLFERALRQHGESVPTSLLAVNTSITVGCLVIAGLYFPPQPLPGLIVALVCFVTALVRSRGAAARPSFER